MLLSKLLADINYLNEDGFTHFRDCEITGVESNTSNELKDKVYVCISGRNADGHNYAKLAEEKGAAIIICEHDTGAMQQLIVEDTRSCYALLCKRFYNNSADKLKLIAATGTNGKTSVSTMMAYVLNSVGIKTGLISTIKACYLDFSEELDNTTPDAGKLHSLFYRMFEMGCTAACLEASSHALDQKRLAHCSFQIAIFTNLTQEHLDYHNTMEEYYQAKRKLFNSAEIAVINIDDSYGRRLVNEIEIPCTTFSTKDSTADFFADEIMCDGSGVSFLLHHNHVKGRVRFAIPGLYSVKNALAVIASCQRLGISLENIFKALAEIEGIKGRGEVIKTNRPFDVICDFAHTPDGLENILKETRQYAKGRVVLLFGCGGDRDRSKRPIMAEIAAKYADFIIVTSDNPRTENPKMIIADILKGMPLGANYIVIADRTDAISYAVKTAKRNDIVILAGKGHEQYQVLGNKKLFYDERRIVKASLNALTIAENEASSL